MAEEEEERLREAALAEKKLAEAFSESCRVFSDVAPGVVEGEGEYPEDIMQDTPANTMQQVCSKCSF